jgi:hypothetical protein
MSDTKKATLFYKNTNCGQVFWDQNGSYIGYIHENDARYRHEYMEDLFMHFGIRPKNMTKIPKNIESILKGIEDED